jgi:hypothetical protein
MAHLANNRPFTHSWFDSKIGHFDFWHFYKSNFPSHSMQEQQKGQRVLNIIFLKFVDIWTL